MACTELTRLSEAATEGVRELTKRYIRKGKHFTFWCEEEQVGECVSKEGKKTSKCAVRSVKRDCRFMGTSGWVVERVRSANAAHTGQRPEGRKKKKKQLSEHEKPAYRRLVPKET